MRIRCEGVSKKYSLTKDYAVTALDTISCEIASGKHVAIIGPSGSGKSTLFNLLGLVDESSSGNIYFDELNVTSQHPSKWIKIRRDYIGYVFQFFNLIPTLTAFENAQLPFWHISVNKLKKHNDHLNHIFSELGIYELKNRFPKQLSGGQEQRVAIARAFANFPKVVLADEPTGNLDSKNSEMIINLVKQEAKENKSTLLVVSHDTTILKDFNSVIQIKDGKIESTNHKPEVDLG